MPVYALPEDQIVFPHPSQAIQGGLLAIGGDLSAERMILAYSNGIFPWNNADEPLMWWCLTPRLMLKPEEIRLHKSMRQWMNKNDLELRYDRHFLDVLLACKTIERKNQQGSWLHPALIESLLNLHELGIAHCVSVHQGEKMIGGLYGLGIGKIFCGESMFSYFPNASKLALIKLCEKLCSLGYQYIDCQQETDHLKSMGAKVMESDSFFELLEKNKQYPIEQRKW